MMHTTINGVKSRFSNIQCTRLNVTFFDETMGNSTYFKKNGISLALYTSVQPQIQKQIL
jgi:hypothetical protein